MIRYSFRKNQFVFVFFICLFIPLTRLEAFDTRDYLVIDKLVRSCYKNTESCKVGLLKINNYQKNAAKKKNFSCQTRLLGLEANLIMVMNSNFKRKDAKSIINDIQIYC